jgi:hypothetical protein
LKRNAKGRHHAVQALPLLWQFNDCSMMAAAIDGGRADPTGKAPIRKWQ